MVSTSSRSCLNRKFKLPNLGRIGQALLLGTGASLLFSNANAQAVETIQLRYFGSSSTVPAEITLSLDELKQFVQTGELRQQVREYFDINRQDVGPLQQVMTKQIQLPSNVGQNLTDTSVGRFVVSQLEKTIQGQNVAPNLQTAIRASTKDDRNISLLELLENYPTDQVTLNITGLVQTYNDVSAFVDRVLPVLEVAKEYLQGVVCDCQQPAAAPANAPPAPQSRLSGDRSATACSTTSPAAMTVPASSTAANAINRPTPSQSLPTQAP